MRHLCETFVQFQRRTKEWYSKHLATEYIVVTGPVPEHQDQKCSLWVVKTHDRWYCGCEEAMHIFKVYQQSHRLIDFTLDTSGEK